MINMESMGIAQMRFSRDLLEVENFSREVIIKAIIKFRINRIRVGIEERISGWQN